MIKDKRKLKEYIFNHIDFSNVHKILDLGCGNGDDLNLLDEMFPNRKFELYGVDKIECTTPLTVRYIKHDLNLVLPFESQSFDLIYSHNLLECIKDKNAHLREIYRLLKPAGQVVCSHTDWDSQLIDGENKDLMRKVVRAYSEWKQPWMDEIDSWLGRRLHGIFNNSGLFKGDVKSYNVINTSFSEGNYCFNTIKSFEELVKNNLITKEEFDEFYAGILTYEEQNKFFYSVTTFIYYGIKI